MARPGSDISVRMTPEGTQEVINALNRVRSEASRTAASQNAAVAGINKISGALQGLRSIVPAIGFAALVTGFVRLTKSAIDTADAIGDLSAASGASAKSLSIVSYAATECGQTFDTVEKGFRRFSQALADLRGGSAQAVSVFGQLGLSAKDLAGLDTGAAFERVATAIGKAGGSFDKMAVSQELFGRAGLDMIEVCDRIGAEGFDALAKRATAAGAVISQDTADSADQIKSSMGQMEKSLESLALQFVSGLAPGAADGMRGLASAMQDGKSIMQSFGEFVGNVIKRIIQGFLILSTGLQKIWVLARALKDQFAAGAAWTESAVKGTGSFLLKSSPLVWLAPKNWGISDYADRLKAEAQDAKYRAVKTAEDIRQAVADEYVKLDMDLRKSMERIETTPGVTAAPIVGGGRSVGARSGGGGKAKASEDLRRAELEFYKAQLEAENKIAEAALALREDQDRDAYESGITNLKEYYDRRRAILEERQRAEIEALKGELAAVENATAKDAEEKLRYETRAVQLRAEITAKELGYQREKISLTREELAETRKLNEEKSKRMETAADTQFDLYQQNLESQGWTREAALNALALQLLKDEQLLSTEQGITAEARAQLDLKRRLGVAAINYEAQRKETDDAFRSLEAEKTRIRTEVDAGRLSEAQGEAQILALEQQRLPILRELVALLQAAALASGNPELIAQAQQMNAAYQQVAASVSRAQLTFTMFKNTAIDAAQNALTQFFTSGIQNAKSFGDAMRQMALSVIQALTQMIAQMLIAMMFKRLFGGFGFSGGGFLGGGGGGGADHMVRMADGGAVSGPGTSTSDSIPARLSAGEFVVNAAAVARPGVLAHLIALNRGMYPAIPRGGLPRFAEGGLATPATTAPASFDSSLTVSLAPGLVASELDTPEGTKLIMKKLGENKRLARQILMGER